MNIYLVTTHRKVDYDDYDAFVCAAPDEWAARCLHPQDTLEELTRMPTFGTQESSNWSFGSWPPESERSCLKVQLIGQADPSLKVTHVVLASFNAG